MWILLKAIFSNRFLSDKPRAANFISLVFVSLYSFYLTISRWLQWRVGVGVGCYHALILFRAKPLSFCLLSHFRQAGLSRPRSPFLSPLFLCLYV